MIIEPRALKNTMFKYESIDACYPSIIGRQKVPSFKCKMA